MQTANTKVVLAEFGGPDSRLIPGDTLENVVSHEIKELGQHVLGCTVSYRVPPNVRHPLGSAEDPNDPNLQTFRKFYKFAVSLTHLIIPDLCSVALYAGFQPVVSEDQSPLTSVTVCYGFTFRAREDFPRGAHTKSDARPSVV